MLRMENLATWKLVITGEKYLGGKFCWICVIIWLKYKDSYLLDQNIFNKSVSSTWFLFELCQGLILYFLGLMCICSFGIYCINDCYDSFYGLVIVFTKIEYHFMRIVWCNIHEVIHYSFFFADTFIALFFYRV